MQYTQMPISFLLIIIKHLNKTVWHLRKNYLLGKRFSILSVLANITIMHLSITFLLIDKQCVSLNKNRTMKTVWIIVCLLKYLII